MGTRIANPEIDYGDDCPYCTPPQGSRFENDKTPRYIYVTFTLLHNCPGWSGIPPNGHSFRLEQDAVQKCKYVHTGTVWYVEFWLSFVTAPQYSILTMTHADGSAFHAKDYEPACPGEFYAYENYLQSCSPGVICYGGFGIVSWNIIPLDLMLDFGLPFDGTVFLENRNCDDSDKSVKFCSLTDATNVRVKFKP